MKDGPTVQDKSKNRSPNEVISAIEDWLRKAHPWHLWLLAAAVLLAFVSLNLYEWFRVATIPKAQPVASKAFIATYEFRGNSRNPNNGMRWVVACDGSGHIRFDQIKGPWFRIDDCVKHVHFYGNKESRLVSMVPLSFGSGLGFYSPALLDESGLQALRPWYRGVEKIKGYNCRRYSGSPFDGNSPLAVWLFKNSSDDWYSSDLNCCVMSQLGSPEEGYSTETLVSYSQTKPEPKLFDLKDYHEIPWKEWTESNSSNDWIGF